MKRAFKPSLLALFLAASSMLPAPAAERITLMVGGIDKIIYLPVKLAEQLGYFRVRWMNPLFPFAVAGWVAITVWSWLAAEASPANSGAAATATLLAGLAALGVVEHLFLVLPMRDAKMWTWASSTKKTEAQPVKPVAVE
jgi:putative photosynthetic complex assembly protein 2